MSEHTYSVYLIERQGSQGGERQVTSPVRGSELDFYDSGVWLTREAGRNFFPYDEIRTIREHAEEETETESDAETATEDEGEGGSGGSDGESENEGAGDEDAERDAGAEEDLVE